MRPNQRKPALPRLAISALVLGTLLPSAYAHDDDGKGRSYSTALSGFNEVHFNFSAGTPPATPPTATLRGAVSTRGGGKFRIDIDERSELIDYELSYQGLEGTVTQAHIHFGQERTVGGIVVWLCQTATNPAPAAVAAATPACPAEGTVTGTIQPDQVLAVAGQGIAAGEFNELVRAIRAGAAYANVHTSLFPPGEIRGQIGKGGGHH
jgi:hypothetical protein